MDLRDPRSRRDARRCPDGPERKSRGAPPPQTGPQADANQRRQMPRSQLSPVLYLKTRGPARKTEREEADTPGGDPQRPVPVLARRPSDSPSIRRRPSSRPRATSTFRSNVAAAAPPSRLADASGSDASPGPLRRAARHGTSGSCGRRSPRRGAHGETGGDPHACGVGDPF